MDDTRDPRDGTPHDGAPDGPTTDATGPDAQASVDAQPTAEAQTAAVARVRAADPAAAAVPDTARLHWRLARTTGVTLGPDASPDTAASTDTAASRDATDDELAAGRARRRTSARWLQVAAVAAGVALVGGGGYAVGAAGGDDPAAPPIALQGAGGPRGAQELLAADTGAMAMPGWFGGRTVFHGTGLTGDAGTAQAWAFDANGVATAQTVKRLADELGVAGEPRLEWGQWVAGTDDGTSATVQVGVDGQASMWFHDPAWSPASCTVGVPETLDGAGASGQVQGGAQRGDDAAAEPLPEPVEPVEPVDPVAPLPAPEEPLPAPDGPVGPAPADPSVCDRSSTPTGDAAVAKARDLVDRLTGGAASAYEFTVSEETGVPGLVSVTGAQVVDGTRTGLGWSVELAGDGVPSVSGPLAALVELGDYDHISADDAVERLNDPRFGASYGGIVPLAARAGGDAGIAVDAPTSDEPTVPAVPAPGDPVAWPVQDVRITGARLGVTQLATPTGALLLVPAWELTDADGGTWSVVAVVEDQLDLSAA